MLPILIQTKYLTIYTMGIFLVLALFWFLYFIWRYVRLTPHREEQVFDVIILAGLAGVVVGRISFVLINLKDFIERGNSAMLALHLYPGIQDSAALIVTVACAALLFYRRKIPVSLVIAHMSIAFCIGMALVSLGTLFAGTVVGTSTMIPLRIKYAGLDGLRHMVGLYQALYYCFCAFLFHFLLMQARHHKSLYGVLIGLMLWVFAFSKVIFLSWIEKDLLYPTTLARTIDVGLLVFLMLTGLGLLVYYLRLYVLKLNTR